ncbi:acyl-CoA synthase [Jatrophihabitans fulvus]
MTTEDATTPDEHEPQRGDDDDYDLLTYNEVVVRLAELLRDERRVLDDLRTAERPDDGAVARQQERIAVLEEGRERYARQHETAEIFMQRFGLTPRRDG